jgi:hypothetical protein
VSSPPTAALMRMLSRSSSPYTVPEANEGHWKINTVAMLNVLYIGECAHIGHLFSNSSVSTSGRTKDLKSAPV